MATANVHPRYNTIVLKDYSAIREEFVANAAISPGMCLELMSTEKIRAHATEGGNAKPLRIALENALQGKAVDSAYSADDRVEIGVFRPGDQLAVLLADGETIVIGDKLESNGDGTFKKHTPTLLDSSVEPSYTAHVEAVLVEALEALDLSGSSGEESSAGIAGDQLIKVEVC